MNSLRMRNRNAPEGSGRPNDTLSRGKVELTEINEVIHYKV
jgi:hypothetical protein